jgi:tetratricopeptide (TPR) repeat protein
MIKDTNQISNKKNPAKDAIKKELATKNSSTHLKNSLGLMIAVFAFLLYAQSISFNYTLDDGSVIKANTITTKGIAGIPTIFKHSYWFGINDTRVAEYRPVSLAMFAVEWQFFPDNPHIGHFVNVLMYAFTCWLLFIILCKLFEKKNLLIPFVCTLLYAAHPIHTEVVDSIKSRDEIVCFLFMLISTYFFLKSLDNNSILMLFIGGFSYLLSLSSKETSISFLIIMPLILFVFTQANFKKILFIFLILFITVELYFFIRSLALRTITTSFDHSVVNNSLYAATDFISRETTAFYILLRYILLLIIPHPLSYDYSFATIPIITLSNPLALAAILVYFALGIYAISTIFKKNIIAFAILFFLLTLAPVSNIFLMIGATMAERFMYMPSLGFCLIVSVLLVKITKADKFKPKSSTVKEFISTHSSLMIIVFIITGLYSVKTLARSQDWKSNIELFGHDVEVVPNSTRAHTNNGISLLKDQYLLEKDEATKIKLLDKAIIEFKRSLEITPEDNDAYDALAQAYLARKDYKNAIYYFELLESKLPFKSSYEFKMMAQCYEQTHQNDKLLVTYDSIIKYDPPNDKLLISKGMVLGQMGKDSLAIGMFEDALIINPKSITAFKDIGVTYANEKQFKKALEYFNKSLEINSKDAECDQFISGIYKMTGDTLKARQFLEKASRDSK